MAGDLGTTEFIDLTTADVYLEEKWSQMLVVEKEQKLVFAQSVDRKYEQELQKGQILRVGNITQPTARAKTINTAVTFETVTETESTITINNYQYAAIAMEDVIKPMVSVNLIEKYRPGLSYALGMKEDDDLAALIDDGTITQTVGTLATGLSYDNLLRADQYLNDANVEDGNRVIITSPAERANFLSMDYFINGDYSMGQFNGLEGRWMQYPVKVTTNVDGSNSAGHDSVLMHKDAIAHIVQIKPVVDAWYDHDYRCGKMCTLITYGHTIMRANHAVWMQGQ